MASALRRAGAEEQEEWRSRGGAEEEQARMQTRQEAKQEAARERAAPPGCVRVGGAPGLGGAKQANRRGILGGPGQR